MNYKWKKIIAFCIALFLGIELFGNSWSVQRTYAISKKLKVNKKKIVVLVKKIATIKVKNAGKKKVKAKPGNKKVATVKVRSKKIIVTGKKAGKTKITVTVKGMKKCVISVLVKETRKNKAVQNIKALPTSIPTNSALSEVKTPNPTKQPSATPPVVPEPIEKWTPSPSTIEIKFDESSIVHHGVDGKVNWAIDKNGCLKLQGNGNYENLSTSLYPPGPQWLDYMDDIITAEVNIKGITSCEDMFYACSNLKAVDVSKLDTSGVTNMTSMFAGCDKLRQLDVSSFDTSKVELMEGMFRYCGMLTELDVSKFDTSNVENMDEMFYECENLEVIDCSGFSTSKVTSMYKVVEGCRSLLRLDMSSFDLSSIKHREGAFGYFSDLDSLTEIKTPLHLSRYFQYDTDPDNRGEEMYCSRLPYRKTGWKDNNDNKYTQIPFEMGKSIDLTCDKNAINISPMSGKSGGLNWNLNKEGVLYISGNGSITNEDEDYPEWHKEKMHIRTCIVDVGAVTQSAYMFADLPYLESITFKNIDTSKVEYMGNMFAGDSSLKSLDLSMLNTSKVQDMSNMFENCSSLTSLDVSVINTEKVKYFDGMFKGCRSIKELELENFNTSNAQNLRDMFKGCTCITQFSLNKFCTDKIEKLYGIFGCCHSLTSLDISSWNLQNVQKYENNFDLNETGGPSFVSYDTMLTQIKTPVNLKVEVKLPEGEWTDGTGKRYTTLPVNESISIVLNKSVQ